MPSALNSIQVDELGTGSGVELQSKRKKKKKRESIPSETVEEVGIVSGVESQMKKKKKKKEKNLNASHTVEEVDEVRTSGGVESPMIKKKKKKEKNLNTSQTVEEVDEVGSGSGVESQLKKKKEKNLNTSQTVEEVDEVGIGRGIELQGKRKKRKRESTPSLTVEEVDEVGTGSGVESQLKKKKKKNPNTSQTIEEVDEAGTGSGVEFQGKRKKNKRESIPSQIVEEIHELGTGRSAESQGKRKKEKILTTSQTAEEVGIGSGVELQGKRKKKKREPTPSETVEGVDEAGTGSGGESQRKKKKKNLATAQIVVDCGPGPGTAKKTILKTQELQTCNGAESVKKKRVTFQLPDSTQDDPLENEVLGEETRMKHTTTDMESNSWKTDQLRSDLVYGIYTPEEDGALKQAVFDYIREQGWDREDGLQKILKSGSGEAKGCWHTIRTCLPHRSIRRLYARAHRLFDPGNYHGKWTSEELQSLIELHSVHGNDWKRISTIIGRDASNCKDKWRSVKYFGPNGLKTGPWSKEEQQKLCALVLKCLHVKSQMAKRGQLQKTHRILRDDINWEFIAEQMDGRSRLDCLTQWYRRMASPMVATGEWSNGDDQRLLGRLMEEFPLSEELVEWDLLLEHRSGELCKRRWEQMQRALGRGPKVRHLHFLERLENVVARYAPHLVDAEYDAQFAAELQRAEADESEEVDTCN